MKVISTMMMYRTYVHGYRAEENTRLSDQAGTLVDLLHADTGYPAGSTVLEVGCGIGAQTVTLAERSPGPGTRRSLKRDLAVGRGPGGDLLRTTEDDGSFCYTFFRATALAPGL